MGLRCRVWYSATHKVWDWVLIRFWGVRLSDVERISQRRNSTAGKERTMKDVPNAIYGQLAEIIVNGGAKRATKYLSPRLVVKATRIGKKDLRDSQQHFIVTVGRPNYAEHQFIKNCKIVNEQFPVKKIQVKW